MLKLVTPRPDPDVVSGWSPDQDQVSYLLLLLPVDSDFHNKSLITDRKLNVLNLVKLYLDWDQFCPEALWELGGQTEDLSAADWLSVTVSRDYITGQTGSLPEQQSRRCLDSLTALKDCGYRSLTSPIHVRLKVQGR